MSAALYECHGHIMMDGNDYATAFDRLGKAGVSYFRDGGDALGISADAKKYALLHPELGIDYVTPVFAIHKKGRYGKIVGRSYETLGDYRKLVREAELRGADYIKIMFSGIITFKEYGQLSCPSLDPQEIKELVNIAHGEGFAVMAHTNGKDAVIAAAKAGTDSIEHGVFEDEESLLALAENKTFWVPTLAAVSAFSGREGFDPVITSKTAQDHMAAVRKGAELGVLIASGSDSGAFGVPHGFGTPKESELLNECGISAEKIESTNALLKERFRKQ